MLPEWRLNQVIRLRGGRLDIMQEPVVAMEAAQ
jgi:hypothetical protein